MKRWAIGFVVFLLTLGIGTGIAVFFLSEPVIGQTHSRPELPLQLVEIAASEPAQDEFNPEFRDLPNFDDIQYKTPPGRLIEILDDGIYRRSDVVAKNGEFWLVLTRVRGELLLAPSKALVKNLRTVSWPGDERDARLSFSVPGNQIIALRGLRNLRAGPVTTLHHKKLWAEDVDGNPDFLEIADRFNEKYILGDTTYVLRVSTGLTENGTKAAVLVLETGNSKQVLKQIYFADPASETYSSGDRNIFGSLLWVGDMDLDGKLDLYFDEFNEKGFTATELHLSSYAESGKLVGLAADFGMPGC